MTIFNDVILKVLRFLKLGIFLPIWLSLQKYSLKDLILDDIQVAFSMSDRIITGLILPLFYCI